MWSPLFRGPLIRCLVGIKKGSGGALISRSKDNLSIFPSLFNSFYILLFSLVSPSQRYYSPKALPPEPFNNPKAIYRDFSSAHLQVRHLTDPITIAVTPLFPQPEVLILQKS